ncbi:MAG: very short patch repair endonuclease [Nocardioidaceae bacterium]
MGAKYTPWSSSPAARRVMQGNRRRDTQPELALRRTVHALGLRYRVDSRPLAGLNRRADLVFTKAKVAVFVDGCYWHGCQDHGTLPTTNAEYWASKIARNVERDKETDSLLFEAGWRCLRVWEHEDPAGAAVRVVAAVHSARA